MRHSLLLCLSACLTGIGLAATGCSGDPVDTAQDSAAPSTPAAAGTSAAGAPAGDGLPVDATPDLATVTDEECPYLDSQWVADTNGQRMTRVAVDHRFSTPACVFWSYPEEPQASVMVREMPSVEEAREVVDHAAPVDATEIAEFEDWTGGRGVLGEEAVFAVQKDTHAVVVRSNQLQTLKSQLIAQEAISRLGL
ncbi:DUF2020 domain-containing protein [Corynebacterium sp. YSMAA1_1_D6]|uniref:DUF2020 domain-containing protein n=1 Tax=unclassified Corynebacterium TaxID=2624378 RepID=UPI0027B924D9|nr:DUF2020 domain-containing protein [Corynebacterium sp.]